ncbi:recombinase family protein [Bradyrhizobium sp. STM 3557]|uniref:recombinase family protein n=1 Tax=Bradyrhizobium sp. STM 3557 TaxID=578920 RepID=UPI00388EE0DE
MTNALVVRQTHLPSSPTARAAQYVRMSTDYQKYSIENQAAAIAAYAHAHNLTIVKTYADRGESGLKLKNRAGLMRLLEDIRSGPAEFSQILVYDVSRWGRFQDIDESAHYEFLCKQAGIRIVYCAEQFDNDGSMLSNVVKNLKRVMAAEYSRELSVKVHTGACRFAGLGFQTGGRAGYGLERVLVNERLEPKKILANGDRKYLVTDHVRLRPGAANEVAVVRQIFSRFLQVRSEKAIARELNKEGTWCRGQPWRPSTISRLLRNENYVGNIVYNRESKKLRGERVRNPDNLWVRAEQCFEPIIERGTFDKVQQILRERRVDISEEEMLTRLRQTLKREGRLSPSIINATVNLPSAHTFMDHFGTLRNAYRLIGYTSQRRCDYLDVRRTWMEALAQLATHICEEVQNHGSRAVLLTGRSQRTNQDVPERHLIVDGKHHFFFRVAYWTPGERASFSPFWSVSCRRLPVGWIVAIRLGEHNQSVLDYVVLPTVPNDSNLIRFRERSRVDHGVQYFISEVELTKAIVRLVAKRSRILGTAPKQPAKPMRRPRSK